MGKKRTDEEFRELLQQNNPTIIPLEKYVNNTTKIKFKCLKCNNEWYTIPKIVLNGHSCPKCALVNQSLNSRKSADQFVKELAQINPNIELLTDYVKSSSKIKCRCKKDGFEWESTPNNLLRGHGCPKCNKLNHLTIDIVKERVKENNKYIKVLTEHIENCNSPIECLCLKCNHTWITNGTKLNSNYGCPTCNMSQGERIIETFLSNNNIDFIPQYYLNVNFSSRNHVYIDFYIPSKNLFIEYNGKQHYIPVERFGGTAKLIDQQLRDNELRNYCHDNNIDLLEIKYTEDVIQTLKNYFYGNK